jgi:hypothetical protein
MRIILCLLLSCSWCFAIAFEEIDITGETNYSKSSSESLITSLNFEYKIKLFEPSHQKYMWYIGGTINPDYDHFGKVMRLNGFTNLGIEF